MITVKQAMPGYTTLHAACERSNHAETVPVDGQGSGPMAGRAGRVGRPDDDRAPTSSKGEVGADIQVVASRSSRPGATCLLSGAANPAAQAALESFNRIDRQPWLGSASHAALYTARYRLHGADFVLHVLGHIKVEKCPGESYPVRAFGPRVDRTLHAVIGALAHLMTCLQDDVCRMSEVPELQPLRQGAWAESSDAAARFVAVAEALCRQAEALDPDFSLAAGDRLLVDGLRAVERRGLGFARA